MFAIAITKGETEYDFEFIFRSLHNANLEWKPSILLADGSEAIINSFIAVFGVPAVRLMCFLRGITQKKRLKEDIYTLQTCFDEEMFLKASLLLLKKWRKSNDGKFSSLLNTSRSSGYSPFKTGTKDLL
jgi:hypothetical protein